MPSIGLVRLFLLSSLQVVTGIFKLEGHIGIKGFGSFDGKIVLNTDQYQGNVNNERPIVGKPLAGFGEDPAQSPGDWGVVHTCPDGSWVSSVSNYKEGLRPSVLFHLGMPCKNIASSLNAWTHDAGILISTPTRPVRYINSEVTADVSDLRDDEMERRWAYEDLQTYTSCQKNENGVLVNSFVIGVWLTFQPFRGGRALKNINYLCANDGKWTKFSEPEPGSMKLECPKESAVCRVRSKSGTFGGSKVLTNIQISCCAGDPNKKTLFENEGELGCSNGTGSITVNTLPASISGRQGNCDPHCQINIPKKPGYTQLRIDFVDFAVGPTEYYGSCTLDHVTFTGVSNLPSGLTLCGSARGQRLHLLYGKGEMITIKTRLETIGSLYDFNIALVEKGTPEAACALSV